MRHTNATHVRAVRTSVQRTQITSPKSALVAATSIRSGSPAALMASLRGTLTAGRDDDHTEVQDRRHHQPRQHVTELVTEVEQCGQHREDEPSEEGGEKQGVDDGGVDGLEGADEGAIVRPAQTRHERVHVEAHHPGHGTDGEHGEDQHCGSHRVPPAEVASSRAYPDDDRGSGPKAAPLLVPVGTGSNMPSCPAAAPSGRLNSPVRADALLDMMRRKAP